MKKILLAAVVSVFSLIHGLSSAADLQVVTVALVSPSWNTGLPTAVARGAGFFKEEGLDVRPVTLSSSGPIMMALLMSGQADMVIAGAVAILRGIARGAPVVVVSGHLSRMSYALMTGKGLKTVADLKGKTIGITGIGGMGEFTVVESLRRHGLIKDRDFSVLNIEGGPAARIAALKTGKVHAVPLTPGQRVQAERDGFTMLLDTRETLTEIPRRSSHPHGNSPPRAPIRQSDSSGPSIKLTISSAATRKKRLPWAFGTGSAAILPSREKRWTITRPIWISGLRWKTSRRF
jgi:NitT/TauT family transport system substrate-binding protein